MEKRINKLFGSILLILLLSGCWDVTSIEDRGFIIGVAIDMVEDASNGDIFEITNQFAVPAGLGNASQSGSASNSYMNLSATGTSLYDITEDISNQINKEPFYEHLKVLIISEEVVSEPGRFANVLDIFIRNRDTHRGIDVILTKDKAKDLLDINPDNEMLPSRYVYQILEKSLRETKDIRLLKLGDIHEHLLAKTSFVISEIASNEGKSIKVERGAVYQGSKEKFDGSLNNQEMFALNLITNENVRGSIELEIKGGLAIYAIKDTKSKLEVDAKSQENIKLKVTIKLEGELQETFGGLILDSNETIYEFENEVEKKTKDMVEKTIKKAQEDFEADVFGFIDRLRKTDYANWKKIKDDWEKGEKYFTTSEVVIDIEAKVRADGVIDQSKN